MGNLPKGKTVGDLSWGARIRNSCLNGGRSHPFSWFLKNVYPELTDVLGAAQYNGEISNPQTGGCIDTLGNHNNGGVMGLCVVLHTRCLYTWLFFQTGRFFSLTRPALHSRAYDARNIAPLYALIFFSPISTACGSSADRVLRFLSATLNTTTDILATTRTVHKN